MKPEEKIAEAFVGVLERWLSPEQMEAIRRKNATEASPKVCHSHDYCDANEVMAAAFARIVGRPCNTRSDADLWLWNKAWNYATREDLGGGER